MKFYLFLFVAVQFVGCKNVSESRSKDFKDTSKVVVSTSKKDITLKTAPRGQATPILNPEMYPNATFVLQSDSITAVETTQLDNGDKLIITNTGWNYYTIHFRIETSRFKRDVSDIPFWYGKSIDLMKEVERGLLLCDEVTLGVEAMERFYKNGIKVDPTHLKLCQPINFSDEELRKYGFNKLISLDRIDQLADSKIALTVTFLEGPL